MATDDRQVLVTGTASAPADFTVPGNGQIRPKAVFAHFDGTAAASAYLPVLKILSDGGEVVAIAPTVDTIAAAGSADVSWFRGLGGPTSANQIALVGARLEATNQQSVNAGVNTDLVYQTVTFDTGGFANLGANNRILTVPTTGYYLIACATTWSTNNAGRRINGIVYNDYISGAGVFIATDSRMPIWDPFGGTQGTPDLSVTIHHANAGDFFSTGCFQASGFAQNCNGNVSGSSVDNFFAITLLGVG